MGSLVPMNEFIAKMALAEITKEERRLHEELAEVSKRLAEVEGEYDRANAELLRHTSPLEREIAFLLAELLRYGIQERHEYCRMPRDEGENTDFQSLYRKIAFLLHRNGEYYSSEILDLAKNALNSGDFGSLFEAYERALHLLRSMDSERVCPVVDDDSALAQSRKGSIGLRLLRKAIESRKSKIDSLERERYFSAWRTGSHNEYIEQVRRQLVNRMHELESKIKDAKLYNPLGGFDGIFGQN